jgi:hypothetical protein
VKRWSQRRGPSGGQRGGRGGESTRSVDPVVVSEAPMVDPMAVREAVGEDLVVDPTTVGEAAAMEADVED